MFKKLKMKLLGWEPSSYEIYQDAYYKYGGGINMHPNVIAFFQNKNTQLNYYHLKRNDEVVAAYFTSEAGCVGFNVWRDYPISYDEVIMPIRLAENIILPEKNNRVSGLHKGVILNAMFTFRNKRKVCIVKETFSAKTVRKRNSEQRKFISDGGSFTALKDMSAGDVAEIYTYLFKRRFADTVRCYEKNKLKDFIANVSHLITGNCLFYKGAPCAIDLIFHATNNDMIYFDVPNGGLEPDITKFSLGSLLMWKNINDARTMCDELNKKMIFSIGMYEEKWNYKLMWADAVATGKSLIL